MNELPIFDSLTHPMPDGNWLHPAYDNKNTLDTLLKQMLEANVKWALGVGMGPKVGGYNENNYAQFISDKTDNIFPVAYIDYPLLRDANNLTITQYVKKLSELGYVGIKLHPRFGQFSFCEPQVANIIKIAAEFDLATFLCTYCWENSANSGLNDPFSMMKLLASLDGAPVILLHGGGVLLMEYIEIARAFSNVLLDLSLTICKYKGSSVDLDIKFAFSQFDRRICVGSDGPEFLSTTLRERFNEFSEGVAKEKLENIAYKNLFSFIPKLKRIKG